MSRASYQLPRALGPGLWRALWRVLDLPTRVALGAIAALGLGARIAIVLAALQATRADAARATLLVAAASAAWFLQRLVASWIRVTVECELYRATSRSLLASDVLAVPTHDLQRAAFESNHHARPFIVQTAPAFVADVFACFALLPVVLAALPPRLVALAVVALVIIVATLVLVRVTTRGLHERALAASDRVYAGVLRVVEGRLEIVARGGENAQAKELDVHLAEYARVARRSNLRASALGRMPVALAVVAVVLAALGDAALRQSLESAVIGDALVLGAFAPIVLGIVLATSELARVTTNIRPLVELLRAPRRAELVRTTSPVPVLPGTVEAKTVTFAYHVDDDDEPILADVSFTWSAGAPLVIVGPNGSGKSTLLRLLLGLRPPVRGEIAVGGVALASADLSRFRSEVAYLPQRPYLGESYSTLREALHDASARRSDGELQSALAKVGLGSWPLDGVLGELSAGQRQRLALARVVLQQAKLVILDEPDANLDRDGIALVRSLVERFVADGTMVAVAAHTTELADIDGKRVALARPSRSVTPRSQSGS